MRLSRLARGALAAFALCIAPMLACADEALPEPIAWRQNAFSIPFKIAPVASPDEQPTEVRLYVSTNQGAKWELAQSLSPKASSFTYRTPADGEYWFAIRSVDRSGKADVEPGARPELRVIVDTIAPRLDLTATRGEAGEVRATWKAVDPLLNSESLKIEYQGNDGKWHPVAIDRPSGSGNRVTTSGTMTWWPTDAPASVAIRAEVSDRAGNVTVTHTKADAAAASDLASNGGSTPQNEAATQSPSVQAPILQAPANQPAVSGIGPKGPAPNNNSASGNSTLPRSTAQYPFALANASGVPQTTQWPTDRVAADPFGRSPIDTAQLPDRAEQSPISAPIRNQASFGSPAGDHRNLMGSGVGNSGDARMPNSAASSPSLNSQYAAMQYAAILPPGERPRYVGSRTFDLDYEVDGVGPYGIAKVELWGTRDGGHTWKSYGVDDDNRSPIRASAEGEGLYGFRIAVQSGNGLGGQPPRDSDPVQMWVVVDLTKPIVRLTGIEPGTGEHAGELLIRWEASDSALAARPITLSFSDKATGPWSIIAAGLENTSAYAWRPDNRAPDRIFVRIEARDEAGNKATFDTTEPTTLEHVRPEGRIREVHPASQASSASGPASIQGWVDGGIMGR